MVQALVLEEFGRVIAPGGAGLLVSSAGGHKIPALSPEHDHALAFTATEKLLELPFLKADKLSSQSYAYRLSKRANSLRVQAEAIRWGERGARLNAISPGLIATPMGYHELNSKDGEQHRAKVAASPAGRLGSPEEIAIAAAYLLGPDASFVTGSDLLIDGGGVAAIVQARCQARTWARRADFVPSDGVPEIGATGPISQRRVLRRTGRCPPPPLKP